MTWPQDAYVGQKVICIGEPNYKPQFGEPTPIIGNTYTIKNISLSPRGSVCFELEEITSQYYTDMNWHYSMFRPIQDTKTNLEIFERLKDPNFKIEEDKFDKVKVLENVR